MIAEWFLLKKTWEGGLNYNIPGFFYLWGLRTMSQDMGSNFFATYICKFHVPPHPLRGFHSDEYWLFLHLCKYISVTAGVGTTHMPL